MICVINLRWLREMVLTYSGLRRLALCSLQTNVLFPRSREPVLFAHDTRHRTRVEYCSTVMCGWKLSGITFNWLVYCSSLNFSKWFQQLCICKYPICVMYLCQLLWHKLMFVYSKYIWKWFVWWTCDDSVKWYWPTLGLGTSHCVVCRQMYFLSGC